MPDTKTNNDNVEYTNLEAGEHEGRLVYVADLGLQEREYMGETKPPAQQLSLGIEIIGQTVSIDNKDVPRILWTKPFNIFYTLTEKGNEMKYYSVFDFNAAEGGVADWDAVLGKPCNVVVKHTKGKGENSNRVYDNISSLTPIPLKYQEGVAPALTTNMAVGDADDENNAASSALFGLAKFVFDKRITVMKPQLAVIEGSKSDEDDDFEDDIPF
tara:strand:- start:2314 stop:2955 length:642 start_codon:yes stop_codon:yes gene_type:complete